MGMLRTRGSVALVHENLGAQRFGERAYVTSIISAVSGPRSMSARPITQAVWPLPSVIEHREMTDPSPTWRPDEVIWPDSASSDT